MVNAIIYALGRFALRVFFLIYLNFKYKFSVPLRKGAKIFAVNHPSEFDAYPALMLAPDYVHTMINEEMWGLFIPRLIFDATDQVKIIRGKNSYQTIEKCFELLEAGEALIIAPEGKISPLKGKERPRKGVIRIALEKRVPIVPIGIFVREEDIKFTSHYIRKIHITKTLFRPRFRSNYGCVFGKPISLEKYYNDRISMEKYQELADMVLEETYRLSEEARKLFTHARGGWRVRRKR